MYGVASTPTGGSIVFLWPSDQTVPYRFLTSLLDTAGEALANYLLQFMFAYVENTYFSSMWWQNLSRMERTKISELAKLSPYTAQVTYSGSAFVAWKISEAKFEHDAA